GQVTRATSCKILEQDPEKLRQGEFRGFRGGVLEEHSWSRHSTFSLGRSGMRYPHHLTAPGFSEHGISRRRLVGIAATKEGSQMKYFRIVLLSATLALVASPLGSAGAQSASVAPQASARANVNGISIMYLDQGQGTAVVFVHGAFFDHRAWEGQREAMVQR